MPVHAAVVTTEIALTMAMAKVVIAVIRIGNPICKDEKFIGQF